MQPQSTLSIPYLQELAKKLYESDNVTDLAGAFFYNSCIKLIRDARLSDIDFAEYENAEALVIEICNKGNGVQRSALADAFSFESCARLPELKKAAKNHQSAVGWIATLLADLSVFFGCNTQGDMQELAWMLFNDYGGLSIIDFVKFFSMCKKREFAGEYEFIKTQGINPDFVIKWMRQYMKKRNEATEFLEVSAKDNFNKQKYIDNPELWEQVKQKQQELEGLKVKATELRAKFNAAVYEQTTIDIGIEDKVYHQTTFRVKQMPVLLFYFIENFVCFDDDRTKATLAKLRDQLTDEFNNTDDESRAYFISKNYTLEEYKSSKALEIIERIKHDIISTPSVDMIEKCIKEAIKKDSTKAVYEKMGIQDTSVQIVNIARELEKLFESRYFDYLKQAVEAEMSPLDMKAYVFQQALIFLKSKGIDRPFQEYEL